MVVSIFRIGVVGFGVGVGMGFVVEWCEWYLKMLFSLLYFEDVFVETSYLSVDLGHIELFRGFG